MGFNEKLAAAKEKGRPSRVVTVSLDADVSGRLYDLEAEREIEKGKPQDDRLAKTSRLAEILQEIESVKADYAGTLVDLKFTRMLGSDWTDLTLVNSPRPDSLPDKVVFGYNFHAVTRAAALQSGVVIEDGQERELTEEEWDDLFQLLSGGDHQQIADVVYALNEGESNRAVELGKALRASTLVSEMKSDSQ